MLYIGSLDIDIPTEGGIQFHAVLCHSSANTIPPTTPRKARDMFNFQLLAEMYGLYYILICHEDDDVESFSKSKKHSIMNRNLEFKNYQLCLLNVTLCRLVMNSCIV